MAKDCRGSTASPTSTPSPGTVQRRAVLPAPRRLLACQPGQDEPWSHMRPTARPSALTVASTAPARNILTKNSRIPPSPSTRIRRIRTALHPEHLPSLAGGTKAAKNTVAGQRGPVPHPSPPYSTFTQAAYRYQHASPCSASPILPTTLPAADQAPTTGAQTSQCTASRPDVMTTLLRHRDTAPPASTPEACCAAGSAAFVPAWLCS